MISFLKKFTFLISVWNSLGISNSQICRDLTQPMSQEFVTELDANEGKLNEEIKHLLDGVDFQQNLSQESSPTCIPSTFPEEDGFECIQEEKIDSDEPMSSPLLVFKNKSTTSSQEQSASSSPLLFSPDKSEEIQVKTSVMQPVVQPFTCSEEKSPVYYEDSMDILEEKPVMDIQDTYLSDEQFNEKYPQHPNDVSFQSITPVTLVTQ